MSYFSGKWLMTQWISMNAPHERSTRPAISIYESELLKIPVATQSNQHRYLDKEQNTNTLNAMHPFSQPEKHAPEIALTRRDCQILRADSRVVATAPDFGNRPNETRTPMCSHHRLALMAATLLGITLVPAQAATVGLYMFTGTVTSVDDPFAAFSSLVAVGVPVSGSFQYSTSADYPSGFQIIPSVTSYINHRSIQPEVTALELVINGVAQRSSPSSLTNLVVGDNVPDGEPFFPAGDFFRYFDQLPDQYGQPDPLVDYTQFEAADSFAVPFASLTLHDPAGAAFSSQDLPRGLLPLSAFSNRSGEFSFFDGNGEDINYGSIRFRIDSIQSVPESGSILLLACISVWMMRRFGWRSLVERKSQKICDLESTAPKYIGWSHWAP